MNFISFFWIINRFEFYLTVSRIPTSATTLDHNFIMKFSISTIRNVASDCACAAIFTFSSACVDAFTFTAWQICWAISIICARLFPFTFSKWVSGETLGITKKTVFFMKDQNCSTINPRNWRKLKIHKDSRMNAKIISYNHTQSVNSIFIQYKCCKWDKSKCLKEKSGEKVKKMNRTEKYYAEKTIQK